MTRSNLPAQPTSFVGRTRELAEIAGLLADPACRLLTLTGPGGIGKTRLAIEAAAASQALFADGVHFVPLQPVAAPDFVVPAIGQAIGFAFHGQEDPADQLVESLRERRLLLVVDNVEHLLAAAGLWSRLLAAAPGLKLLVTSREVLGLREEWVRPVAGLPYPETDRTAVLDDYAAVQLFAERARQVNATFSLERELACAVRVCRLVQGMPLAIELATAWLRTLRCAEVAGEIERSLDFLATTQRNVPERHRNVRAVFEQAWSFLPAAEREAYARLSVLAGSFDREAAAAVGGASLHTLQALVDRSLLAVSRAGRYEIHELLRQFATERLAADPATWQAVHDAHCAYYAGFLARREPALKGADQLAAAAEIAAEMDNLRAAWHWAVEQGHEDHIRQSMGSLHIYYQMRSQFREAVLLFDLAAGRFAALTAGSGLGASLTLLRAWFYASQLDTGPLADLARSALEALRAAGTGGTMAMALAALSWLALDHRPEVEERLAPVYRDNLALFEAQGDRWGAAWSLYGLGSLAWAARRDAEAEDLLRRSATHFRAQGDAWGSSYALNNLGLVLLHSQDHDQAERTFQESLRICEHIGDPGGVAFALHHLGHVAGARKQYRGSLRYLADALQVAREFRDQGANWHVYEMAKALWALGEKERAVEILACLVSNASDGESREYLEKVLAEMEPDLAAPAFSAAWQRGQARQLDELALALLREFLPDDRGEPAAAAQPLVEPLSERELEVLRLVAAGLSNREIAQELVVTLGTAKKHVHNIYGKLEAGNRTQAVARARALGLLA